MGISGSQSATNIIVRHNLIQSTGWRLYGEGIYVGTTHEDLIEGHVSVHIYGNTFRGFTLNGIDLKPNSRNSHIHHNIFEEQVPATPTYRPGSQLATRTNEGTISSKGTGNHIHDNIFRNLVAAGPGIFVASEDGGHRIVDNVIMGVDKTSYAIAVAGQRFGGAPTEITNNTFCDLPTYAIDTSSGIINIHNNPGIPSGAPQAQCNAEISRILAEMKALPGPSVSTPSTHRLKAYAVRPALARSGSWRVPHAAHGVGQTPRPLADSISGFPKARVTASTLRTLEGETLYRFTVPIAGTYAVWGRVLVNGGDSFYVGMDDNTLLLWTTQNGEGNWVWDQVHEGSTAPVRFTLTTGTHTLRIKQREDGTKLDQILITNDLSYTPK